MDALLRRLSQPGNSTNWVWKFFRKYPQSMISDNLNRKKVAICTFCLTKRSETHADEEEIKWLENSEINYGQNQDPTKLEAHLRSTHKQIIVDHYAAVAKENAQSSDFMNRFVIENAGYVEKHLEWVCRTL